MQEAAKVLKVYKTVSTLELKSAWLIAAISFRAVLVAACIEKSLMTASTGAHQDGKEKYQ